MRAIAVAAVVIYHAAPGAMPGGFVGVDVFFVLSGYLITALLVREWAANGRIDFTAFYARRARRLLPALVAMLLGVMLLLAGPMGRHESLVDEAATSSLHALAFLANFHFQASTGGYFDAGAEMRPMLHLWSLAVEEQFYLVYPLLLVALLRFAPGAPARRLAMLALGSLLLAEYWVNIQPERAFYQMPARFWELAAGGLVALSPAAAHAGRLSRVALPAGLALVLLACLQTGAWGPFPGKSAMPVVAGTSLALLAIHRGAVSGWVASLLRSGPMVGLGLVSYSLYLWHWPLLVIAEAAWPEPAGIGLRLLACLAALVLAWASWRFVERPFRRPGIAPARALGAGLAACVLAAVAVAALARIDRLPAEVREISDAARQDLPSILGQCHFDTRDEVRALKPEACHSRPGVPPTYALWGDSHALAWQPYAWWLAEAGDASAAPLTLNSCPPGPGDAGSGDDCVRFNGLALDWLAMRPLDILVIAQRWPIGYSEVGAAPPQLGERVAALSQVLEQLGHVRRILVMGPLPDLSQPAPDCIALGWEDSCSRTAPAHRQRVARAWRELDELARRHPNVELVDPTDYFCDERRCPPARHGFALFWDSNHISASASLGFAEAYAADPARYTRRPIDAAPDTESR
nr:acyltransferase family protein [Arenimonas sp. SCN 70-307]